MKASGKMILKMEKENFSLYLEKYGKNVILQPKQEEGTKNEQKYDNESHL